MQSKFNLNSLYCIKRTEIKQFICIALMMFCILFTQNIIRAAKDSVVNTMIGVEVVSFIKIYVVVPASILFIIFYIKLITKVKANKIFYGILSSFAIFFLVFGFIIFPNLDFFHPDEAIIQDLILKMPNLKWFILLLSNWSLSLFYTIVELWPTVVFNLLCWQFINNITTVEQSRRFYILFGLITQTGMIISGQLLMNSEKITDYFINKFNLLYTKNIIFIQCITLAAVLFCILTMLFFWIINNKILPKVIKKEENIVSEAQQLKAQKKHLTLRESLIYIAKSRYIMLITVMLLCYGISINLIESPWKAIAVTKYSTPEKYAEFVGGYLRDSGILTIILVLFGFFIIRIFGWKAGAIFTPLAMFITGGMFFIANKISYDNYIFKLFAMQDQIGLVIFAGTIQNIITKSSKYTLFDSTKEMLYVPLELEMKTKGKAAADLIGSKLGKSVASFFQSLIFIFYPNSTYIELMDYFMVCFFITCIIWFYTVHILNKDYLQLSKEKEQISN
ncbi:MAG: Npt1/Npt2 family nucleotide transporter [Rickettsiales bacterium]